MGCGMYSCCEFCGQVSGLRGWSCHVSVVRSERRNSPLHRRKQQRTRQRLLRSPPRPMHRHRIWEY
ncbi:predicted protein [Thalassiosira pseudonana CCMP1335]|uniref:Uncharacterized protein n=1 Tax=Thalassiosira pseudonana TaxID=35128 RepID=B8CDP9_THAPS|nr:predicted protein [Thalassiosira pseudonana CCMP1335]EED88652.1 predicted protein [Thalassiosira pseudonana CCMP1335]